MSHIITIHIISNISNRFNRHEIIKIFYRIRFHLAVANQNNSLNYIHLYVCVCVVRWKKLNKIQFDVVHFPVLFK